MDSFDNWLKYLQECEKDGAAGAEKGCYDPPYPGESEDPEEQDAAHAYKTGFQKRRRELGDKFLWA